MGKTDKGRVKIPPKWDKYEHLMLEEKPSGVYRVCDRWTWRLNPGFLKLVLVSL